MAQELSDEGMPGEKVVVAVVVCNQLRFGRLDAPHELALRPTGGTHVWQQGVSSLIFGWEMKMGAARI